MDEALIWSAVSCHRKNRESFFSSLCNCYLFVAVRHPERCRVPLGLKAGLRKCLGGIVSRADGYSLGEAKHTRDTATEEQT